MLYVNYTSVKKEIPFRFTRILTAGAKENIQRIEINHSVMVVFFFCLHPQV